MNLESTAEALSAWTPSENADLAERERRLERFGQFAFSGFGIVLVIAVLGLIYTIFTKMVLVGEQPWAGVLLIGFLIFATLTLTYVVFNEDLKEKRKKARPAPPNQLERAATTGKLLEKRNLSRSRPSPNAPPTFSPSVTANVDLHAHPVPPNSSNTLN